MGKRAVYVLIELVVPYEEYSSRTKNDRAASQICSRIREIARDELSFIPLRVDKEDGQYIEDCSSRAKIVVKRSKPF